ncbi:MAG: hypothetical protein A4E65_03032 [Syntrophorhabdus sp. PtaU1.Bin153]|nr:MAG: hypothetical protein A4E65_03032 [Syntrophorhabdus sp. PtaU1.Bin153]
MSLATKHLLAIDQLAVYPNWVCGRADKSPVDPKTGKDAKANDPTTWGTHDQAKTYLEAHKSNGTRTIGFEVGESPFVAIDLDHCRDPETGIIEPWAREIKDTANSYTEISPSQTGLRIITTVGEDFPKINRKKGGLGESGKGALEIANTGKYFSVTGNHLEGTPDWICSNPKGLQKVIDQYFSKILEVVSAPKPTVTLEDEEIIRRAENAKNGAAFKKLYSGDWNDYSSQSEADLAFCGMLAFWTKNQEQIDRIYRGSGLMRPKWEREDYRTQTITKAIQGTPETYQGRFTQVQTMQEVTPGQTVDPLTFPDIMTGAAGGFASTYSNISEAPKHFYYMAYLTCLGSILSGDVRLKSLLTVQPRLYTIFLGASGRGRKSTPISITTDFFQNAFQDFGLMHHANSGEGLGIFLEKSPNTLLVYDEFMGFVSKAIQKGNTLLGTVTTLFEKNQYQTATKDKQLLIENAYLSILGACTEDTWQRCWHPDFTAIGLVNRLFLVSGGMEKLVPIPPTLDVSVWKGLLDELRTTARQARLIREYALTPEAEYRYDQWYRNELDHKSIHSVRLDTYALRFMLLLAISNGCIEIDEGTVNDVIKLITWEHHVRQQLDPIDADTEMAKVEIRIRRELSKGPQILRILQQRTNAQRTGLWLWKTAMTNLQGNGEVFYDTKSKTYRLAEKV